jgi:hypothetical protein
LQEGASKQKQQQISEQSHDLIETFCFVAFQTLFASHIKRGDMI